MKQFYLIVLSLFVVTFSFATPIIATQNNGVWKAAITWDKNRKPQDNDTIVVPAGKTILVTDWQSLNNVYIKVYGTLKFQNAFSALNLNASSRLTVYAGGALQSTLDFVQYVLIGGNYVFYEGSLAGPLSATSSGFGGFNALPVKFVGFTVSHKNTDALIQWSTTEEMNVNMFEVERSLDSKNWNTIAYVSAIGNSGQLNNYSFTDKNVKEKLVYYRIKETERDGNYSYTNISILKNETMMASDVKIASVNSKVLLQFPQEIKGQVMVRFVSLSGQVVNQKAITNPVGQIVLENNLTGNYIISVSNGNDVNTSKQVIL